jgi:putative membrane-bound dehydrogenase-like protein
MKIYKYIFLLSLPFFTISCAKNNDRLQQAMKSFQLEPGLRIELIAAEPLVIDPVALAFDEDKRMYVVEDRGYPDPAEGGEPPKKLGRIARLEDTNGDGKYDHRTEFATGFTYPNGILPWRGGVFVTCAPDIFYLKDTTGDGITDVRKVVLTGFNDTRTAQIRMSYPTLGLDGWIYVTGGLNGGEVVSPQHPERPAVSFSSADGRFDPETFEFEVTGGKSQFGLTFDSYGRRFGSSNRHPVRHVVLEPSSLRRNRHLSFTETINNVSKVEAEAVVFPISNATTSADFIPNLIGRSHAGTFTSACGLLIYNGTALTPEHKGNVFICEPAQNLIQRQIIHPDGVSFRSELPYEGREFLSSTDTWFNPVFLQHGPEGALYLADMHRKVIDHPSYVPEEARVKMDFESGKTDGRIYRIVREDFEDNESKNLNGISSSASAIQIVRALESPEEWERKTTHRLLLENKDLASVPMLETIAVESPLPEARVRALWLLHSFDALKPSTVKLALSDKEAGVQEQAVLLAGAMKGKDSGLMDKLIAATNDANPRVRFTSALVLGSLDGPEVVSALAAVATKDGVDKWVRAAVLSGIGSRMPEFLAAFRKQQRDNSESFAAVMQDLGRLFGSGGSIADCQRILADVLSSGDDNYDWRISTALGLAEGLNGRTELKDLENNLLLALQNKNSSHVDRQDLDKFINKVAARAGDNKEKTSLRVVATALLGYTSFNETGSVLHELLGSRNPLELQVEAVNALARQGDIRGGQLLTAEDRWPTYTPRVRSAVIAALVSRPAFTNVLFDAIEKDIIAVTDISATDRRRMMGNKNKDISSRAENLFKELEGGERMQVYKDYRKVIEQPAEAALGKAVFSRSCSACHTYNGEGGNVGPDLTGVKNQPADALLLHTLVPNYEVYTDYQAISVKTSDGSSLSGRLVAETENSLTLRTAFGTDESILRTKITSLTNTGLSLMPDGLEQSMTKEELAQLIAYLKSGGEN